MGILYVDGTLTIGGVPVNEIAETFGTPLYIYDESSMRESFLNLRGAFTYNRFEVLYAAKANSNIHILKVFKDLGAGLDAVSPYEVLVGRMASFPPESILFTGNSVSDDDMRIVANTGALINVESMSQLRRYAALFGNGKISLRLNLGYGGGYHSYLVTGGKTKFGLSLWEVNEALKFARDRGIEVIGLHTHMGSGITDWKLYQNALLELLKIAERIEEIEFVDVGGGFAISYRGSDPSLDILSLGKSLSGVMEKYRDSTGKELKLLVEPGRYLVASSGILIARVTDIKKVESSDESTYFVGVDTGMGHLIRPALYGAYHEIVPVKLAKDAAEIEAHIVGNYCESGDVLAHGRKIQVVKEGDLIALLDAGAYGYSMSSNYNLRPRPAEVIVRDNGKVELIRKRETLEDLVRGMFI
ncbi:MAG: diaminopimelate decarboxylase [Thermoprotei archaeon]|nr:diaminopimelate decarboxylase [Thermoprotei archaeon]